MLRVTIFRVLVFFFILGLFSCIEDDKENEVKKLSFIERNKIPDNEIWNLEFYLTREGELTQKVKCGHIRQFIKGSRKNISYVDSGLRLDFYKNTVHQGVLLSKEGILDEKRGIYKALKDVVVTTPKGDNLYTEELILYRNREKVQTDKAVMFVDSAKIDTLYGDGFISDLNFISYELVNPRGKAYITSEEMGKFNNK